MAVLRCVFYCCSIFGAIITICLCGFSNVVSLVINEFAPISITCDRFGHKKVELHVHASDSLALALELISQNTLPHMRSQLANLSHELPPSEARRYALVSVSASVSVSIRFQFQFQFGFSFSFGLFRARARHSNGQHYYSVISLCVFLFIFCFIFCTFCINNLTLCT